MTAMACNYQGSQNNFGKIILGLLLIIAFAVCAHALWKHGEDAVKTDKCLEEKGPWGTWVRDRDGAKAFPCDVEKETIGVKINKANDCNGTCLIKEKLRHARQVINWLHNQGFHAADDAAKALEATLQDLNPVIP